MYAGYAQVLSMKSCFVVNMTLFEEIFKFRFIENIISNIILKINIILKYILPHISFK